MDAHCKRIGIGCTKEDPRSKYYTSPYSDLKEKGFVISLNLGTKCTIDEVNLGGDVYTLISNPEINKIIACIPGTKVSPIVEAVSKQIPYADRLKVREITLDMSMAMDSIAMQLFPQAKRTLDRFHVTKNVLEDVQAIRMRAKTRIKDEELELEDVCKKERRKYIPKKLQNSETKLEFITRLRYQLFERRKDWSEFQQKRWEVLLKHEEFYEIMVAYELLEQFYTIYDSPITQEIARPLWNDWFRKISRYESIKELQNSGRMIKNHLEGILNYFDHRSTNAFAE
jgi:transposase